MGQKIHEIGFGYEGLIEDGKHRTCQQWDAAGSGEAV